MKKILSLMLALAMVFGVTGCKEKKNTETDKASNPLSIENFVDMDKVRKIDELDSFNDLNEAEEIYYNYLFIESIKTLDTDTLSKLKIDSEGIEKLKKVKENPERKHLWDITLGEYIYLPQSRQLVYPCPKHIYCMWMEYAYSNPEITPNEVCNYDFDSILELYDKYYDKAYYTAEYIDFKKIDNLAVFFYANLRAVDLYHAADGNMSEFIFPEEEYCFASEEYLLDETCFPDWPYFIDFKIDRMAPVIEKTLDYYYNYRDEFNYYFVNAENKQKLQEFIDTNCKMYKTPIYLTYFAPFSKDTLNLSEAEAEYIKDITIYEFGFFKNKYSYEYLLSVLLDSALSYKIIEPFSAE